MKDYLGVAFLLLFIRPVHCGTSKNEGGKNAMEAIYDINLQMDEIEANEMIDIDERFEYVVPDDIPEGAAAGLIKKQQQRLWKNGIVYFRFSNAYSKIQKEIVRKATRNIEEKTCIRFKELQRNDPSLHHIYIVNKGGCWSFVGKSIGRAYQEMSLKIPGCVDTSIATHEFIHALGTFHEQARPDRDQYVNIHRENMLPGTSKQFDKKDGIDSLGIPYDGESIMHYSNFAFSNKRGPTISWKGNPRKKLGGSVMSASDIRQINMLYGCRQSSQRQIAESTSITRRPIVTTRRTTTIATRPLLTRRPTTRKPKTTQRSTITTTITRRLTSTKRPVTTQRLSSTRRTSTMKATTTNRLTFKACNKDAVWCRYVYNLRVACRAASLQISCPVLCGKCTTKMPFLEILTTRRPTTTTRITTTTTTTTKKTMKIACFDVSNACSKNLVNCNFQNYQRICRKSCGQCAKPLPTKCRLRKDQIRNCPERTQNGCYSFWQKQLCSLSCCLRNEL